MGNLTKDDGRLHPDSTIDDLYKLVDCNLVLGQPYADRCSFIHRAVNCDDHVAVFNYLDLIYCKIPYNVAWMQKLVIPLLVLICILCFYILGVTADVRLCPALQLLSKEMKMSETLAGVTLVAFGNCAPDFFSSIFAVADPDRQVYSDIFASTILVTSLLPGLIIVISPFRLHASSMLRDISYILFGVVLLNLFLANSSGIDLTECITLVLLYFVYIIIISVDQYLLKLEAKENNFQEDVEVDLTRRRTTVGRPHFRVATKRNKKNAGLWRQFILSVRPFSADEWREANVCGRFKLILYVPILLFLNLLIPNTDAEADYRGWSKLLNSIQLVAMPFCLCLLLIDASRYRLQIAAVFAGVCTPFAIYIFVTSRVDTPPKYHWVFAIYSAVGSTCVISLTANEICELIYCIGLINGMSSSFLGATLLAFGNCIGDLVANLMLAHHGFQLMGFAACFGSPIFNLFCTLGASYILVTYDVGVYVVNKGVFGELANIFLIIHCILTLLWMSFLDFNARRMIGVLCIFIYVFFFTFTVLTEIHIIDTFTSVDTRTWQ